MKPVVHIYSDGACSPNPGLGGWAAVLISPQHDGFRKEISGSETDTTNNRMELFAALAALRALKRPCTVLLHTDSRYLRDAFEEGWLVSWQKNGWRTAARKPVLNQDLWQELLALAGVHDIKWIWVQGHGDDVENNRCDALAVQAREELRRTLRADG